MAGALQQTDVRVVPHHHIKIAQPLASSKKRTCPEWNQSYVPVTTTFLRRRRPGRGIAGGEMPQLFPAQLAAGQPLLRQNARCAGPARPLPPPKGQVKPGTLGSEWARKASLHGQNPFHITQRLQKISPLRQRKFGRPPVQFARRVIRPKQHGHFSQPRRLLQEAQRRGARVVERAGRGPCTGSLMSN